MNKKTFTGLKSCLCARVRALCAYFFKATPMFAESMLLMFTTVKNRVVRSEIEYVNEEDFRCQKLKNSLLSYCLNSIL